MRLVYTSLLLMIRFGYCLGKQNLKMSAHACLDVFFLWIFRYIPAKLCLIVSIHDLAACNAIHREEEPEERRPLRH